MDFIIHVLVTSIVLVIVSRLLRGIEVDNWLTALVAAVILGLLHSAAAPVAGFVGRKVGEFVARLDVGYWAGIAMLVLPMLLINAVVLKLTAAIGPGFRVRGFGTAILGALLIVLANSLIGEVVNYVQGYLGDLGDVVPS